MKHPYLLFLFGLLAIALYAPSPAAAPPAMRNQAPNQSKVITTSAKYRHGQSTIVIQQTKPAVKLPENISAQNACNHGASMFELKKGELLASSNHSNSSPGIVQWYEKVGAYSFTTNHNPNTIVYYLDPVQPSLIQTQNIPDWKQGAKPIHYTFDPSAYQQCHTGK